MTLQANWFQTNVSPLVNARDERRRLRALSPMSSIVLPGDFLVSPVGAGTTLAVTVAACASGGGAVVAGQDTHQGSYFVYNDAALQLPIAAADPTNPRIDTVVVRIYDDEMVPGAGYAVTAEVVKGTPLASPVAPTLPRDCLALADVRVNVAQTGVGAGSITDRRRVLAARPWGIGWGRVGSFIRTAADLVVAANQETMIVTTGLFLFRANRNYEIVAECSAASSLATNRLLARLYNVTDNYRVVLVDTAGTSVGTPTQRYNARVPFSPGAADAVKEFQMTGQMASGSGNVTFKGANTPDACYLAVHDVGPVDGSVPTLLPAPPLESDQLPAAPSEPLPT